MAMRRRDMILGSVVFGAGAVSATVAAGQGRQGREGRDGNFKWELKWEYRAVNVDEPNLTKVLERETADGSEVVSILGPYVADFKITSFKVVLRKKVVRI